MRPPAQFNPGSMRYRLTLQRPSPTRNPDGEEIKGYVDAGTVWAEIDFGSGREYFATKVVNADVTHVATIYTFPGLDTTWRGRFDDAGASRYFDFRGIRPADALRSRQILECRELVGREVQS